MAVLSIAQDPAVTYPASGEGSPAELFPEYPYRERGAGDSAVYGLVRRALRDAGADAGRFGSPEWNPLGEWIRPGERVFVLPNFVTQRRAEETPADYAGKCTHASVIRPVLDYARIAAGSAALIGYGNAAIQACAYDRAIRDTGAEDLSHFYREAEGVEVGPHDLRGVVIRLTRFGALLERRERNPEEQVEVDLGKASLLDELFRNADRPVGVRVGDYDPRETESYHAPGRHVYVVNRRLLESQVIISVPKLKTHQKVGITCALKGTVGSIARKECLAHHRKGGPGENGDEYPRSTLVGTVASDLLDRAAQSGIGLLPNGLRVTSKLLYRSMWFPSWGVNGGAWHGNDTAWRMAVDIARVLTYARPDGTLSDTPQRRHLVLVDGITAGEGEGPLKVTARPAGLVLFASDPCWADYYCALAMGYDPMRIPMIRGAFRPMDYPLAPPPPDDLHVTLNGEALSEAEVAARLNLRLRPPKGWRGAIEREV